jgi:hypothetical protein
MVTDTDSQTLLWTLKETAVSKIKALKTFVVFGQYTSWSLPLQRNVISWHAFEVMADDDQDAERKWHLKVLEAVPNANMRKVARIFGPYTKVRLT